MLLETLGKDSLSDGLICQNHATGEHHYRSPFSESRCNEWHAKSYKISLRRSLASTCPQIKLSSHYVKSFPWQLPLVGRKRGGKRRAAEGNLNKAPSRYMEVFKFCRKLEDLPGCFLGDITSVTFIIKWRSPVETPQHEATGGKWNYRSCCECPCFLTLSLSLSLSQATFPKSSRKSSCWTETVMARSTWKAARELKRCRFIRRL